MAQLTPSSPSQRTSLRAEHPPSANSYGSGIRILIVEDEETLRESCASILSHDGYNVASTGLAREAQNLLRHSVFDVLLLDWYMSEIPGAELLPVALAANPATRVIAVTGKATLASSLEAMRISAWAYLPSWTGRRRMRRSRRASRCNARTSSCRRARTATRSAFSDWRRRFAMRFPPP